MDKQKDLIDISLLEEFGEHLSQREELHLLGVSHLRSQFSDQNYDWLTASEKTYLAYFLPMASWIRQDPKLLESCFSTILNRPKDGISVHKSPRKVEHVNGLPIDQWILDVNILLAGEMISTKDAWDITLHFQEEEIKEDKKIITPFLDGGKKKRILEDILIPQFLGKECLYQLYFQFENTIIKTRLSQPLLSKTRGLTIDFIFQEVDEKLFRLK